MMCYYLKVNFQGQRVNVRATYWLWRVRAWEVRTLRSQTQTWGVLPLDTAHKRKDRYRQHKTRYHFLSTNWIEHIPSWEADSSLVTQEIPSILENHNVRRRVHYSPLNLLILSHINPTYVSHHISWSYILILPSHLSLCIQICVLRSGFPDQNNVCTSPFHHSCYMHGTHHYSWPDNLNNICWGLTCSKVRIPIPGKIRILC
jgi:hypothetical protein